MVNLKTKKVVSKKTKKNARIEILDFEEATKYEKRKPKLKFHIKNKFRFSFACLAIIAILLTSTSLITGKSVVSVGVKKVLNGLGVYTEKVRNVEIQSDSYNEPGSWHIDKSAEWVENNKAKVTFDVQSVMKTDGRYKDVILVLDVSGSMFGEKLEKAVSDSKELVNYLLKDSRNKMAIVTFESTSEIVSNFTNDKEILLEKLSSLTDMNNTNYNAALQNVDLVMNGYAKESNRDVVTLFLTDGYPNEDTPNQVGTYATLKDKYPYMAINGVQYEMGTEVINAIKQITDSQWVADQATLNNVLFEASVSPIVYEDFMVTDYIHDDYFKINSVDDIKVTKGTVKLEEESGLQKITWNLGSNSFMTGGSAKMEIDVILKEQYVGSEGFYPTNKKENVVFKLPEENEKTVNSTSTPVLQNNFNVIYDTNTPDGCTLDPIEREKHFIYQNVTKKVNQLSCEGYLFKGWEFDEEDAQDIKKVNDDIFVMPEHDVTIRATWTKQAIKKSMDGKVHEKMTLYKVLENEAKEGAYAKEYTGEHQDSMDVSKSTEKIYHWYNQDVTNKNNVIFAGQCWQMMRTTDTGGVKMIYNGEAEGWKCLNTRENHVGYNEVKSISLASNYWYGTDYTYDSTTKTFKIGGTTEQATWNETTGPGLLGKYTCKLTTEDGTCSTLYLVESYNNTSSGYVVPLDSNSHYSQFGQLEFNAVDNSPTHAGYMYGNEYLTDFTTGTTRQSFVQEGEMLSDTYLSPSFWCGDEIEYDPSTDQYTLKNPYEVSDTSEYPSMVGKYAVRDSDARSYGVYYIIAVDGWHVYYQYLLGGELLSDFVFKFGESITNNGDGTYTINNLKSVTPMDWYTNYASYKGQYTCGDSSATCVSPRYVASTEITDYYYMNVLDEILIAKGRDGLNLTDTLLVRKEKLTKNISNYSDYKYTCNTTSDVCTEDSLRMVTLYDATGYYYTPNRYYGNSVTWDGTNYTLVDPIGLENFNNFDNLSTHHYICDSYGAKTCSSVGYVYYYYHFWSISKDLSWRYIPLKDGVTTIEDVLEDSLTKNMKNSTIKNGIEAWYKKYLLDYDDYIEDTIFCNDRSIGSLGGWDPNGGRIGQHLTFRAGVETDDLSCTNVTDRFSVSNDQAKLTYKVGLMSAPEMSILNNSITRRTEQDYTLISPDCFSGGTRSAFSHAVRSNGNLGQFSNGYMSGVRPAISLKPGTEYSDGDGSMEHPYIVE